MEPRKLGSGGGKTPSFVRPFLHALNRMQANEVLRPGQYVDRAQSLLIEKLGDSNEECSRYFCKGVVGIIADHTHYFDGFALLLRLQQGVAVAIRRNALERSRVVLEGVVEIIDFDAHGMDQDGLPGLFAHLVEASSFAESGQFDLCILGAVPTGLGAAFHGACAVGVLRALQSLGRSDEESPRQAHDDVRDQALQALDSWYGNRFSPAYVIGCLSEHDGPFLLVDTCTLEHIPVELPTGTRPGWAVIEWSRDWSPTMRTFAARQSAAARALVDLQKNGFENIVSLRELEHRDLEGAIDAVPRRSRAILKHLVSENRNVQKLVVAIRKNDWQFLGALMLISQASKMADWDTSSAFHELVTNKAESASLEGIFGIVQTGEGGCMLVAGQPFSLPSFLDEVRDSGSAHTSEEIETFII